MNLSVKDVPSKLHQKLRMRADENKRSLNREIIFILEHALETKPLNIDLFLADLKETLKAVKEVSLTDEWLRDSKNQGRP